MALTLRATGLGSGIDKDRQDYTVFTGEWEVGRTRKRAAVVTFCQTVVFRRHSTNGPN